MNKKACGFQLCESSYISSLSNIAL